MDEPLPPCSATNNILAQFRSLRFLKVIARQRYTADVKVNQERDRESRGVARTWIEELVAEKLGVRFEEIAVEVFGAKRDGKYYAEDAWKDVFEKDHWRKLPLRFSYTYEGERQDENTLSIREVIID